jgi:hypothetical protein
VSCCGCPPSVLRFEQTVTLALVAARVGGRDSLKAATTNRVRDYRALEREFITGDMSLRGLCRAHGVTAHSAVMVQARREGWAEKRRAYRDRASSKYIELRADRAALREAEVRDNAIEAIDEAITKFRADLHATERKLIDGEWVEVPAVRLTPRDLALLIDRLQVLFGHPAMISEGRDFAATVTSEAIPVDVLKGIVEATRGHAGTAAPAAPPLPRLPRRPEG